MATVNRVARGVLSLIFLAALAGPAFAQESLRLVEQDIKAGLLYNFLRYTQWPAPEGSEAIVCVFGRDSLGGRLQPMAGRTVNHRVIEVRRVNAAAETDACSLLFIGAEERARWPQLRTYLAGKDVLTVSDFAGFADNGGMIEFVRANSRVGVVINVEALDESQLSVQDRMLRLASSVRGERRTP